MTGFGRGEATDHNIIVSIELSGTNRKQAEIVVNLPKAWMIFETSIRQKLVESISRGRVYANVSLSPAEGGSGALRLNESLAREYGAIMDRLSALRGKPLVESISDFLRVPDMVSSAESDMDEESMGDLITRALDGALGAFLAMRTAEGAHLKEDMLARVDRLESLSSMITEHAPSVVVRYRESLQRRLQEAGIPVDLSDERIIREIGLFAERCDIAEELTRLRSHFEQFRSKCEEEGVGRSLDFLCQEINREFNTIGSKANDATLAHCVVEAKTELEKIREQVQNIE